MWSWYSRVRTNNLRGFCKWRPVEGKVCEDTVADCGQESPAGSPVSRLDQCPPLGQSRSQPLTATEGKTGEERCFPRRTSSHSILASSAWARFLKPARAWESCESHSKGNPEPTLQNSWNLRAHRWKLNYSKEKKHRRGVFWGCRAEAWFTFSQEQLASLGC